MLRPRAARRLVLETIGGLRNTKEARSTAEGKHRDTPVSGNVTRSSDGALCLEETRAVCGRVLFGVAVGRQFEAPAWVCRAFFFEATAPLPFLSRKL